MRRVLAFVMLMALVLPLSTQAQQVEKFESGQVVVVDVTSKPIRISPSSGSRIVTTVVQGDELTILSDRAVEAEGYVWWNIHFAERDARGWLPDSSFSAPKSIQGLVEDSPDSSCWTEGQFEEVDGAPNWSDPPEMVIDTEAEYIATISTTKGEIVVELDAENAPIATNTFYCLATAGYYDGTDFHRISEDFLIQGGDPTGTGTSTPGFVVPSDPTTGPYPAGSIALANREPDQNGSQFFITAADLTDQIPDVYPVFGQVISGMEIVTEISRGPVEPNPRGELSAPQDPTSIISIEVGIVEEEIGPPLPTPSLTATVFPTPAVAVGISLIAKDIAYDPTEITIAASDLPIIITMENTGAAEHDFVIDALDISVATEPGETVEIEIPAGTAPGEYQYYCSVPGHKEAGMIGTLYIEDTINSIQSSEGTAETCVGFTDYANAVDRAERIALAENPDALAVILKYWEVEDEELFESMTSGELLAVGGFLEDYATSLKSISPPGFAAAWHESQIEMFQLLSEFLETAASTDVLTAALLYGARFDATERQEEVALLEARICPAFVAWATEEDEDDTWNQARLVGIAILAWPNTIVNRI